MKYIWTFIWYELWDKAGKGACLTFVAALYRDTALLWPFYWRTPTLYTSVINNNKNATPKPCKDLLCYFGFNLALMPGARFLLSTPSRDLRKKSTKTQKNSSKTFLKNEIYLVLYLVRVVGQSRERRLSHLCGCVISGYTALLWPPYWRTPTLYEVYYYGGP